MLVDYYFLRKTRLDVPQLFEEAGVYRYANGWNPAAIIALALGVLPNLPGFLKAAGFVSEVPAVLSEIYTYAWFGPAVAGVVPAADDLELGTRAPEHESDPDPRRHRGRRRMRLRADVLLADGIAAVGEA
jgi:hypothetical protein